MRFFQILLFLFCVFAVSGCATSVGYHNRYISYVGMHERDLINSLGNPDDILDYDGSNKWFVYRYNEARVVHSNGTQYMYKLPLKSGSGGSVKRPVKILQCDITFEIVNNVVNDWTAVGNNCLAGM